MPELFLTEDMAVELNEVIEVVEIVELAEVVVDVGDVEVVDRGVPCD